MALAYSSQKPWVTAVQEIADSAGASGDPIALARAHTSLSASFNYYNSKKWYFLLAEANPISVVGTYSTAVSASAGQSSATVAAGHGIQIDDILTNSNFLLKGTRITATATAGTSIGFNTLVTGSVGTGVQGFTAGIERDSYDLPTDFKAVYSVRMLQALRVLRPMNRRLWDRSITDEFLASSPFHYDIFSVGAKGKIRLLTPPAQPDTLMVRYYRRMAVASASGATATLDIPLDYEPYIISWAKWHMLTDKGEGRSEQAQTWFAFAKEGMATMLADQSQVPDEDLQFIPGAYAFDPVRSPNQVRGLLDDWT